MISASRHPRVRRQVERLFHEGLPRRSHVRLWQHLRTCAGCRRYYERLREVEEMIAPDAGLSQPAIDRLATLAVPAAPVTQVLHPWRPFAAAVAMASLAVVVGLWLPETDETLIARGRSQPGLSVFRIDAPENGVERLMRTPPAHVHGGEVIQLAYHNDAMTSAFVIGVDASGAIQWYHPRDVAALPRGVALSPHVADEPFGMAWTIAAPPGRLRLYAVFSDGGITAAEVEAAAQRAGRIDVPERLPGVDMPQDSVLLEVDP